MTGTGNGHADAGAEAANRMHSRNGRLKKRQRVDVVVPESEQQAEEVQEAGSALVPHPADSESGDDEGQGRDSVAQATAGRRQSQKQHGSAEQHERDRRRDLTGRDVVVADSLELGSCRAAASADVHDEVSSADTSDVHEPPPQKEPLLQLPNAQHPHSDFHKQEPPQSRQQQQPAGQLTTAGQGRVAGVGGQAAGAGQLLSGEIQWVGPSVDPPTGLGLGLTPSQHQTFYAAFTRVSRHMHWKHHAD